MKRLSFDYSMVIRMSESVSNHRFELKCVPRADERARVLRTETILQPDTHISETVDSFQNHCLYGCVTEEHDRFELKVTGSVETGLADSAAADDEWKLGMYRYPSGRTLPGIQLSKACAAISDAGAPLETAINTMKFLRQRFQYEKGVTGANMNAETAFAIGSGVCQDYAHIMLALLRMKRIPCRYVAGLMMGEGESHAWVDVYHEGRWYGLDPTNNCAADDNYIAFSCGRDAGDCLINKGMFRGWAQQSIEVRSIVYEI